MEITVLSFCRHGT